MNSKVDRRTVDLSGLPRSGRHLSGNARQQIERIPRCLAMVRDTDRQFGKGETGTDVAVMKT